jgi:basic membrane protein A
MLFGMQRVEKQYTVIGDILPSNSNNYETDLLALSQKNDIVFASYFTMEEAMKNAAAKAPDKKFVIIDSYIELPNVVSVAFKTEEGSFLMGVIAGKMTKSDKVGFIGGMDIPVIEQFEAGFTAGVKAVNPKASVALLSGATVKYIDTFSDTLICYKASESLYNSGCDVIFHAARAAGNGLFDAAKDMNKYTIGVDTDQQAALPEYKNVILSSMVKKYDTGVNSIADSYISGVFKAGITKLGLKEDGVCIAPSTNKLVPSDIIELVNKYSDDIKSGKIVVPDKRSKN